MRAKSLVILNSAKETSSYYGGKLMKIGIMEKSMVSMDFFLPILSILLNLYLSLHLSAKHFMILKLKTRKQTRIVYPFQR